MDEFDVVVIGGGPSGSTAAHVCARAGLRTCLVDKCVFPRDKLCGGLITPRTRRLYEEAFHRPWPADLALSSDRIEFYQANRMLARVEGYCTLFFTMRRDFDVHLVRLAEAAGARLIVGDGVRAVDVPQQSVILHSGARIRYRVLVGADGVNSMIARTLYRSSFDPATIGFGLEVEVPRAALARQRDTVEIDLGIVRWGYGWVFPKPQTFTIGVGGIHRLNPDLRDRLADYLQAKGISVSELKVKGHYIPFGDYRRTPGRSNVLLCGDAAGTVDPVTGEGIAYALQTGRAAGRAAAQALGRETPARALALYMPEYLVAVREIRQACFWRYLIFPRVLRRPFAWAFADAGTLQRGYLGILAGRHDYDALYGLCAVQVGRAIRKGWRAGTSMVRVPWRRG